MDITAFHFLRPLWLLALLPALFVWMGLRRAQRHSNPWTGQCDAHLLPHLLVDASSKRVRAPLTLLLIAWIIATIAAAGPTWTQLPQPVFRAQATRVIVLDLSRSMNATDISPSRLARAKFKVLDLLRESREGQTAMIVFAGEAYVLAPLTNDADTIAALVPVLSTDLMPSQGSRVDLALVQARQLLTQSAAPSAEVILITDGAESIQAAEVAAAELRNAGHRLSLLMAGTAEGAPIPLSNGGFLKEDKGAIIIAKAPQDELTALAAAGGGRSYSIATDNRDIDTLLRAIDRPATQLREAEQQLRFADSWRDEGPWLVLLLLPLAALAFRRGWVAAIAVVAIVPMPQPAMALDWQSLWSTSDQRAAAALEDNHPEVAAQLFEDPAWKGTAHYRAADFAAAEKAFSNVDSAQGRYNLGNALAQQGKFQEALAAYQDALNRDPSHADALFNKELVEQFLKDDETEQQQSSQGDDDGKGSRSGKSTRQNSNAASADTKGSHSDETTDGEASDDPSAQNESAGTRQKSSKPQSHSAQARKDKASEADPRQNAGEDGAKSESKQANRQSSPTEPSHSAHKESAGADKKSDSAANPTQTALRSSDDVESQQAAEQWLRQIPDDPGGLLRRKFAREHQRINAPRGAQEGSGKW